VPSRILTGVGICSGDARVQDEWGIELLTYWQNKVFDPPVFSCFDIILQVLQVIMVTYPPFDGPSS